MAYMALASAAISTGGTMYAQKQASRAADAEANYREGILARRATDERNALRENTKRRFAERQRRLAEVRARQAASGFAESGTQLVVFGEFQSRLDEEIEEATNQGIDRVASHNEQIRMSQFATGQRKSAERINQYSTLMQGATAAGSGYYSNYRQTGGDPFSLFN